MNLKRNLLRFSVLLVALMWSCKQPPEEVQPIEEPVAETPSSPFLVVLGTVQDAGSPHMGCKKECCKELFDNPDPLRRVVSLGIIDPKGQITALFEATPDLSIQAKKLKEFAPFTTTETPRHVFLTHAHIGHYSGLMYFGKEAMNADSVAVHAMPRMKDYLETNGPWDLLVSNGNIELRALEDDSPVTISNDILVTPFTVPHRDEYSETVGYLIEGPSKKVLFIPDIDKWEKWETSIVDLISDVDYAFVDATFYDGEEINHRDISQIPHPFVIESMELFKSLPSEEKKKVYFIHFNHTNPLLNEKSTQYQTVIENGFKIATIHDIIAI